ncbi:MAG TPA: histidinol dehydrogenase [Clostridia bacterium]|nr:histidinol dehydrogenase [Clostridia bacterium]
MSEPASEERFCRVLEGRGFRELLSRRNREVGEDVGDLERHVNSVLKDVATRGDEAILEATSKYDGVDLDVGEIPVQIPSLDNLRASLGRGVIEAIEHAATIIRRYHILEKEHTPRSWMDAISPGAAAGKIVVPLERVGIYVPGGRAPYVSTVLMTAIPAKVAGVKEIIMCTPPVFKNLCPGDTRKPESLEARDEDPGHGVFGSENGKALPSSFGPAPEILAAARVAGVNRVFRVGGPQAIAAMAYGTETIPKVDKIVGPGNRYVQAAKMAVFGLVDVDMPAGPSEVCVIADETASGRVLACDLLSQTEHGPDSLSVLLTTSQTLLEEVRGILAGDSSATGGDILLVLVDGLDEAIELANLMAPEHLQVMVEDSVYVLRQVRNVGAVYVGPFTPTSLGDYSAGPSHVLPTQGSARAFGALGVGSFLKTINVAWYSRDAYEGSAAVAVRIAEVEGMKAHATSLKVRLDDGGSDTTVLPDFCGLYGSSGKSPFGEPRKQHVGDRRLARIDGPLGARRFAEVVRATGETRIRIALDLDGPVDFRVSLGGVGDGFFGHMLDTLAYYWGVSLEIEGEPDPREPECGGHHLLEDIGIVLGKSLKKAIEGSGPIERFAHEVVPMDDALVAVALDISGRPHLFWDVAVPGSLVDGVGVEAIREFFAAFSRCAGVTLHVRSLSGDCSHHIIEAVFKAFGRALSRACTRSERDLAPGRSVGGSVNSTKGVLD